MSLSLAATATTPGTSPCSVARENNASRLAMVCMSASSIPVFGSWLKRIMALCRPLVQRVLRRPAGKLRLAQEDHMSASVHSGMGANPFEGGVAFRVWAPFADKVCVAGTFNDWKDCATALTSEGNGFWSTDFGAARIGHQYKFVLRGKLIKDKLWKNDPYARSLTNSAGNSIIAEADFDWTAASYRTPAWNEMVIYELHVGSFLFDRTNRGGRGDFDTVITKLGYLVDLGVNVIQL